MCKISKKNQNINFFIFNYLFSFFIGDGPRCGCYVAEKALQ